MGSRGLIRRFRTGPQSEPRGHVSSTRAPVAGVALASEGVRSVSPGAPALHSRAEDSRAPSVNAHPDMSARAIAPPPGSPGATTETDRAHGRRVRQTSLPRHSSGRSTERPFPVRRRPHRPGPGRPFRLASVPRSGMTNTDVRLGTHPGDQTRQGPPYARSITSRTLCLRLDRSAARFPLAPLRNGVPWSCGVDERGAAGTLPGAAQGRRIPDPVPSTSGPEIAATAVERRRADAPGVAGTVPGVARRVAGIAGRVRDRGVARTGLRSGSVAIGGCRAAQRLRA